MGSQPTADYVRKLSGQISGLMRCGEYERVVSGEFPIHVLACGEGGVLPFIEKGAPLEYVIPSDAAMVTHRYCAVPKKGGAKAAAKLFCAFLMTKSGQEFQWTVDRQDSGGSRYQVQPSNFAALRAACVKPLDVGRLCDGFPVLKYAKEHENIIKVVAKCSAGGRILISSRTLFTRRGSPLYPAVFFAALIGTIVGLMLAVVFYLSFYEGLPGMPGGFLTTAHYRSSSMIGSPFASRPTR